MTRIMPVFLVVGRVGEESEMRFRFKVGDIAAIVFSVAVTVGFSSLLFFQGAGVSQLQVETPVGVFLYPLDHDRVLSFEGTLGVSHIVIENHQAHFEDSPCANKLCLSMGHFFHRGDWAACLPNRIFARIVGGGEEVVDAKVY